MLDSLHLAQSGNVLELTEGLARVAGRALDNAVLFDEIRGRNVILHELVEFGVTFASPLEIHAPLPRSPASATSILGGANTRSRARRSRLFLVTVA